MMRLAAGVCLVLGFWMMGCASAPPPVVTALDADSSQAEVSVQRPLPHPIHPPALFEQAIDLGTRTADGQPGADYWQQTAQYVIDARLFPEAKRLEGHARITYENHAPHALEQVHFELAQNLHAAASVRTEPVEITGGVQLEQVRVGDVTLEADADYEVLGTQLVVNLPAPLEPGTATTFTIRWQFTIPQAGAGGRMGYSEDNMFFLAYWYPQVAVYDDVYGWMTDSFTGGAEFYADFANYDLTIEAPEHWLVMATGALQNPDDVLAEPIAERMREAYASDEPVVVVGPDDFGAITKPFEALSSLSIDDTTDVLDEALPDDPTFDEEAAQVQRLRWHFRAQNVRDVAFSATRESIWEAARTPIGDRDRDGETDTTYVNTIYRESAPFWSAVTKHQQHALTYFSEFTDIPYPWPHMTAVEGGGIIGGGMEFPMMTLMGDYNTRGDSALYYVTAHELAHMWVPMIVSTNERRYSWMDEGMTSFAENQARFDYYPGQNHNLPDLQTYLFVAAVDLEGEMMRWSDYHYPGPAFGIASYSKPASVLVALRGVLGEAVFMRAYRAFLNEWSYKHPYPWDFFNTMERVSGRDLDWFWHSWYYTTWTFDQAIAEVKTVGNSTQVVIDDLGQIPMPTTLHVTLDTDEVIEIKLPVETWLQGATQATVDLNGEVNVVRAELNPGRVFPDVDWRNDVWERD